MNILRTVLIFAMGLFLGAIIIHSRTAAAQGSGNVEVQPLLPSPLIEKFDLSESLPSERKVVFYSGWANGLFTTTKDPGTMALGRCLQKLTFEQIAAMVDKWSADHRETFKNPMSTEMIEAVTAAGSPCQGIKVEPETKNVSCTTDNLGRVSCNLTSR